MFVLSPFYYSLLIGLLMFTSPALADSLKSSSVIFTNVFLAKNPTPRALQNLFRCYKSVIRFVTYYLWLNYNVVSFMYINCKHYTDWNRRGKKSQKIITQTRAILHHDNMFITIIGMDPVGKGSFFSQKYVDKICYNVYNIYYIVYKISYEYNVYKISCKFMRYLIYF